MVRAPCCEKMGLKKGPWTPQEDHILIYYIQQHGHGNWRALPKQAGLLRCGKSCRLRWINYLKPDLKRGNFSKEEEETIIKLHEMLGNRWSAIAARLPGRTDNEIKNVWHTHLKKKLKHSKSHQCDSNAPSLSINANFPITMPPSSPQHSSSELSSLTDSSALKHEEMEYFPEIDESFWSDEPSTDNSNTQISDFTNEFHYQLPLSSSSSSITTDESLVHWTVPLSVDNDRDFWYNLFIRAGDLPELPEF